MHIECEPLNAGSGSRDMKASKLHVESLVK